MEKIIPTLGILATPYINNKNKKSREIILDKTLVKVFKKKNINYKIIPYTITKSELNELLNSLDGLIFPGGQIGNFYNNKFYKAYYKIQQFLIKRAKHINSLYRPFPILGICNGYENMILIERNYNMSKNHIKKTFIIVKSYKNYNAPLFINNSRERGFNKTKKITHNNLLAIDPKNNTGQYVIIATSLDKNNKEFIAIVKHKKYPFYGFQGHPEINNEELIDPFIKVVKVSFSKRKSISAKTSKTYRNTKIYKNSKNKTLKLRVLNSII
jgi:GMP synthase-like glutamine amidotransferase